MELKYLYLVDSLSKDFDILAICYELTGNAVKGVTGRVLTLIGGCAEHRRST